MVRDMILILQYQDLETYLRALSIIWQSEVNSLYFGLWPRVCGLCRPFSEEVMDVGAVITDLRLSEDAILWLGM